MYWPTTAQSASKPNHIKTNDVMPIRSCLTALRCKYPQSVITSWHDFIS